MSDPPITLAEVASIRPIGVRRLQTAIRAGALLAFRDSDGRYRTTLGWVDAWLKQLAEDQTRQRADRRTAKAGRSRRKAKVKAKANNPAGTVRLRRNPDGTVDFRGEE